MNRVTLCTLYVEGMGEPLEQAVCSTRQRAESVMRNWMIERLMVYGDRANPGEFSFDQLWERFTMMTPDNITDVELDVL